MFFLNCHKLENLHINKKDSEKIENLSNVVYLIKCKFCEKVYIGETDRRLKIRIAEHKRDCTIGNNNTGLRKHAWALDHFFGFDFLKINILSRESVAFKRRILEFIYVKKVQRFMNKFTIKKNAHQ